jgi:hypothetical protein
MRMHGHSQNKPHPFDNPLSRFLVHGFVSCVIFGSIYFAITAHHWMPLIVGFGITTVLEGFWIYFLLRR